MQDSAPQTYFTAVELESGQPAMLLIESRPGKIVAWLKSADDEQTITLGRDDGQPFKSSRVEDLIFLVGLGFERFRSVRFSPLPHAYVVGERESRPRDPDQKLH